MRIVGHYIGQPPSNTGQIEKTFPYLLSIEQLLLLQDFGIPLYELECKHIDPEQKQEHYNKMQVRIEDYNQKKKEYDLQMKQYYTDRKGRDKQKYIPRPNIAKPELPILIELQNQYSPVKQINLVPTEKFRCYKALYEKQFWITSGLKFGGDWLLYPEHPNTCHSNYIVDYKKEIKVLDLISGSRLGTSVNKKRAYVWWNEKLEFVVFEWSDPNPDFSAPAMDTPVPEQVFEKEHERMRKVRDHQKLEKVRRSLKRLNVAGFVDRRRPDRLIEKACRNSYNQKIDISKKIEKIDVEIVKQTRRYPPEIEVEEFVDYTEFYQSLKPYSEQLYGAWISSMIKRTNDPIGALSKGFQICLTKLPIGESTIGTLNCTLMVDKTQDGCPSCPDYLGLVCTVPGKKTITLAQGFLANSSYDLVPNLKLQLTQSIWLWVNERNTLFLFDTSRYLFQRAQNHGQLFLPYNPSLVFKCKVYKGVVSVKIYGEDLFLKLVPHNLVVFKSQDQKIFPLRAVELHQCKDAYYLNFNFSFACFVAPQNQALVNEIKGDLNGGVCSELF
ncbi:hypothetical protein HDV06_007177 [Boothiomyces sp. JEL0866]|nr:hypothetical protein HDV06_007177 [Boothiomyces sp. JEL0866]